MVSFFGGTKDKTTTNKTFSNAPDWLQAYLDSNIKSGMNSLQTQANSTADQRIMGFTPDELAAQDRIRNGTGQYDDIIGSALGTLQQAQQKSFEGVNPEDIQKFMNPYQQNVTDITKRETVRDADIQRAKMQAGNNAASAFGGSGGLLRSMELDRNLGQNLSDIQYKGNADAFTQALNAARQSNSDAINAGGAIGNLASTGSNIYNRDTASLAASGEAQRNLEQQKTDFTYTNPFQTAMQGQSLIQGAYPLYGTTSTQTTPVQQQGWGSQLLGGALAIGALGTGGGSTIAGSLLSGMMSSKAPAQQKDGGAVHMKDGGEPLSKLIETLGPTQVAGSNSLVFKDLSPAVKEIMSLQGTPTDVYEMGTTMPMPQTQEEGVLPNDIFSITSPDRNLPQEDVSANRMEEIYGKTPTAAAGLEALVSDKASEPNALQRIIDGTNLPLLKMGLTMMMSDKPFAGAIGEGGLAGLDQIAAERKAKDDSLATARKNALEMLQAQNTQRDIDSKIGRREAQTAREQDMLGVDKQYKEALSDKLRQQNSLGITLKNKLDSLDKQYNALSSIISSSYNDAAVADAKQKMMQIEAERAKILNNLVTNNSGSVQQSPDVRDSSELPE